MIPAYYIHGLGFLDGLPLAQAIAQIEGFNTPGTLAARNNNPGNIRSCPGQVGTDSHGFAVLPSAAAGWSCLDNWIASNSDLTLSAATDKYLGIQRDANGNIIGNPDKNDPSSYLNFLVSQTGLQPGDTLSGASSVDTSSPIDTSTLQSGFSFDLSSLSLPVLMAGSVISIAVLYFLIRR